MTYIHLTASERCHIFKLKVQGLTLTQIADATSRHKSTISRELRRNKTNEVYCPFDAHRKATAQSKKARGSRPIRLVTWEKCIEYLAEDFSPMQAAGRCRRLRQGAISHQSIYRRIAADKLRGGHLYKSLRCRKNRRKLVNTKSPIHGRVPDRVDIDLRPAYVEHRRSLGHWEFDTVAGKKEGPVLVTMVERKSGFGLMRLVHGKKSYPVARAIIDALLPYKHLVKTMTYDNGNEFYEHKQIASALCAKAYFAKPYHAWERGSNENWNGLGRQYFPKKKSLIGVTPEQVLAVQTRLNNRPRKRLDWRTPAEVFLPAVKNHSVALAV